jgi:hypothetical protein
MHPRDEVFVIGRPIVVWGATGACKATLSRRLGLLSLESRPGALGR